MSCARRDAGVAAVLGAPPPLISSASVFHRYPSCCSPVFLIPAAHHQRDRIIRQAAAAAPWPHPTARASRRRAPHRSSGSPALPSDGSARRSRSATSSGSCSSRGEGGCICCHSGRSARLVSKTPPELTGRNAVAHHSPCRFRMPDRRSEIAGSRSPRAVCAQRELVHPV